jgi:hypothetical protein
MPTASQLPGDIAVMSVKKSMKKAMAAMAMACCMSLSSSVVLSR